jgi:hypothetical protein
MISRHFSTFYIAGFTYYDGIDVIHELKIGSNLRLEAEPENGFDPHAVVIYYGETKLGFIPRGENKLISQFLQLGYTDLFELQVNRISLDAPPEKQISVLLRIRKKEG